MVSRFLARLFVLQNTSATLRGSTRINGLTCFLVICVLPEQNIYPKRTRILLLHMGDDPRPVEDDMRGTVKYVDDML